MKSYFEKEYEVNSINININKKLGIFGMLGILEDIGTIHAAKMGIGMEEMVRDNAFWVFTQQKLIIDTWPKWQDRILLKTWTRKVQGLRAYRDYTIHLNGEQIGKSVAAFMVLDGTTRKPIKPNLDPSIFEGNEDKKLDIEPIKVVVPKDTELINTIKVRNSDLDMNNHVNNTKYSQWILDSIPITYHRSHFISEFDMNFISEAHLGDEIDIFKKKTDEAEKITSFYQGIRKSDKKIVFSCHIKANLIN